MSLFLVTKIVLNTALVDRAKIILPPLHIKLGLMKAFVKAMDNDSDSYNYLRRFFPCLSDAKVKEGNSQRSKFSRDAQSKRKKSMGCIQSNG